VEGVFGPVAAHVELARKGRERCEVFNEFGIWVVDISHEDGDGGVAVEVDSGPFGVQEFTDDFILFFLG